VFRFAPASGLGEYASGREQLLYKHIRTIFSVFALAMIVLFALKVSADAWAPVNWSMLLVSAAVCLLVFRRFLFIFNYSYSLASFINGITIIAITQNLAGLLLAGGMAAYGLRLLWFTHNRTASASYAPRVERVKVADKHMPTPVKFALWVQCTFLYTFHLLGLLAAAQQAALTTTVLLGAAVLWSGLLIETVADVQKQAAKAERPDQFVTVGLFARWRHPNYIGEILVQVGILIAGMGAVTATWGNIAAVVVAPLYIILLMIAECLRADDDMDDKYGEQAEFQAYRAGSGSFMPRF